MLRIKLTSENKKFVFFSILFIIFFKLFNADSKLTIFPLLKPDGDNFSFSKILKLSSSSYSPTATEKSSSLISTKDFFFLIYSFNSGLVDFLFYNQKSHAFQN